MIIQNHSEFERIENALNEDFIGCSRFLTPRDSSCSRAWTQRKAPELNGLCKRLFPKIIKGGTCPCSSYNEKYIRHKCKVEMTKWLNKDVN